MQTVVPLPDEDFYLWQAIVQAVELDRLGWPVTYLVYHQGKYPSPHALRLAKLAPVEFWREWRTPQQFGYNAAMKPWLVGKWLERRPEYSGPFLLLDPDAVPTGATTLPEPTATTWYGTDTDSYTGPGYIRSKGEGLWLEVCELVGVDPAYAEQFPGIGAQYATAGSTSEFWCAVAEKSIEVYQHVSSGESIARYTPEGEHPLQSWTAEMYVMQLEMVRRGVTPVVSPEMEMVWADGPASGWERVGFFHDAGQVESNGRDFHKQTFQRSPWRQRIKVSPESASARYVELIRRVAREYPTLIW